MKILKSNFVNTSWSNSIQCFRKWPFSLPIKKAVLDWAILTKSHNCQHLSYFFFFFKVTIYPTVVYALKKIHIARTTIVYSMKENFLGARLLCTQWRKTSWVPDCRARTDEISSCWHDLRARYSDFFIQFTMRSCLHWRNGILRTLC